MLPYLLKRLLSGFVTLFLFVSAMFFLADFIIPGDFTNQFILTGSERAALQAELGLDLPMSQRYLNWLTRLAHGSLGTSLFGGSVSETLQTLLPSTLFILAFGTAIAFSFGLWLGKATAWRGPGFLSSSATFGAVTLYTTFPPWLAFLMTYFFAQRLDWFRPVLLNDPFRGLARDVWPAGGITPQRMMMLMLGSLLALGLAVPVANRLLFRARRRRIPGLAAAALIAGGGFVVWAVLGYTGQALDLLGLAALPIVTYALLSFGETALIMRTSMVDTLAEDYVRTARAKGLSEADVRDRHAARNALLPVVSRTVISIPYLLTGLVILEDALNWPGISDAMFQSLYNQDFPMVMGAVLMIGIVSLLARLVLDVLHAYLNPQIRYAASVAGMEAG